MVGFPKVLVPFSAVHAPWLLSSWVCWWWLSFGRFDDAGLSFRRWFKLVLVYFGVLCFGVEFGCGFWARVKVSFAEVWLKRMSFHPLFLQMFCSSSLFHGPFIFCWVLNMYSMYCVWAFVDGWWRRCYRRGCSGAFCEDWGFFRWCGECGGSWWFVMSVVWSRVVAFCSKMCSTLMVSADQNPVFGGSFWRLTDCVSVVCSYGCRDSRLLSIGVRLRLVRRDFYSYGSVSWYVSSSSVAVLTALQELHECLGAFFGQIGTLLVLLCLISSRCIWVSLYLSFLWLSVTMLIRFGSAPGCFR